MLKSLRAKFLVFVLPLAGAVVVFAAFGATGVIGLRVSLGDLDESFGQMRHALRFARYANLEISRALADGLLPGDTFAQAAAAMGRRADSALVEWRASIEGEDDPGERADFERVHAAFAAVRRTLDAARTGSGEDSPRARLDRLLADSLRPALTELLNDEADEVLDALTRMERSIGQSSPWIPHGWWEQTRETGTETRQVIAVEQLLRQVTRQDADLLLSFHVPSPELRGRILGDRRAARAALADWENQVNAESEPGEDQAERQVLVRAEQAYGRVSRAADEVLELLERGRRAAAAERLAIAYAPVAAGDLEPALDSAVSRDSAELESAVHQVRRIGLTVLWGTGSVSAVLLILGLALPWLLARTVVARLTRLTRAAERMAAGDRGTAVAVGADDEIGRLEQGFNVMAATLGRHEHELQQRAQALERARDQLEDRVQARTAELAEREELFRLVIENAGDEVIVIDEAGLFVTVNRRACEMLGYTREELARLRLSDIETRASPDEPIGPRLQSLAPGAVMTTEGVQRRKDGTLFPIEARVGPVIIGGHRLFLAIARDVTEQHRTREALQAARDAAVEASRLKSDFLANMSHEIRTPLNGVIGMTGLLLDSDLSPRQREDAETIRRSAENLLTIINDILDLSRIEAGKLMLEPAPFDLEIMVDEVAGLLAAPAEQKGIDLIVRIAPDAPRRAVGDVTRLRQVLTNLAGNAVKFTARGHVLIDVSAEAREGDRARLRFVVEDTGIGIPSDQVERIFEKFEQVDSSIQRRFGGTGLGLAISRLLVEAMSGEIGVSSRLGEGSRFWFAVPLPVAAGAEPATPSRAALAGARVLVADDNAVNRRVLREQLEHWGLRPGEASSGAEALPLLRAAAAGSDPYALAILDYDMPEQTGEALARELRGDPVLSRTIVILLSSVGRRPGVATGEDGVAAWLVKPVRPSQLLDTLAAVTTGPGHRGPPRAGPVATALRSQARVLLAEDNEINQKVASRMLEKLGCRVEVVADGRAAVRRALAERFDLILMDCQMPGTDGFQATAEIRNSGGPQRQTPIVALTAHAMAGDRERCLAAGMDDYLSKPVREEDLVRVLERYAPLPAGSLPAPAGAGKVSRDVLLESVGGDPDLLEELLALFRNGYPGQIGRIRAALSRDDAPAVAAEAHALKGSMGALRAAEAAALASRLEGLGRAGTIRGGESLLRELEQAARDLEHTLAALIASVRSARA